jgi:hypothetical protein
MANKSTAESPLLPMATTARQTQHNTELTEERVASSPECVLCSGITMESTDHLFSSCPTASSVLRSTMTTPLQQKAYDTWSSISTGQERQRWASAMWTIWKERNARIFRNHARLIHALIHDAREQATLWAAAYRRSPTSALGVT